MSSNPFDPSYLPEGYAEEETERFIIGKSEDIEAEYGFCSENPITLLSFYNDEVIATEGFASITDAMEDLKRNNVPIDKIEFIGS